MSHSTRCFGWSRRCRTRASGWRRRGRTGSRTTSTRPPPTTWPCGTPIALRKSGAQLHYHHYLLSHDCPAKRQGASFRQAAVGGCHNPTPCWTRQIQATLCMVLSIYTPLPPAGAHCASCKCVCLVYPPCCLAVSSYTDMLAAALRWLPGCNVHLDALSAYIAIKGAAHSSHLLLNTQSLSDGQHCCGRRLRES